MSSSALNLKAIVEAMEAHDLRCTYPLTAVRMSPFECDRLGWEELRGVPIEPDGEMQTGRFRLECDRPLDHPPAEDVAVEKDLEVVGVPDG